MESSHQRLFDHAGSNEYSGDLSYLGTCFTMKIGSRISYLDNTSPPQIIQRHWLGTTRHIVVGVLRRSTTLVGNHIGIMERSPLLTFRSTGAADATYTL